MEAPTAYRFARVYGVADAMAYRWQARGLPLSEPEKLLAALALQKRPPALIRTLSTPAELRRVKAEIEAL